MIETTETKFTNGPEPSCSFYVGDHYFKNLIQLGRFFSTSVRIAYRRRMRSIRLRTFVVIILRLAQPKDQSRYLALNRNNTNPNANLFQTTPITFKSNRSKSDNISTASVNPPPTKYKLRFYL